jgi:hypothetical protein
MLLFAGRAVFGFWVLQARPAAALMRVLALARAMPPRAAGVNPFREFRVWAGYPDRLHIWTLWVWMSGIFDPNVGHFRPRCWAFCHVLACTCKAAVAR